jgi:hypothetical protein
MFEAHQIAVIGDWLASERIAELQATANRNRGATPVSRVSERHTQTPPMSVKRSPLRLVSSVVCFSAKGIRKPPAASSA